MNENQTSEPTSERTIAQRVAILDRAFQIARNGTPLGADEVEAFKIAMSDDRLYQDVYWLERRISELEAEVALRRSESEALREASSEMARRTGLRAVVLEHVEDEDGSKFTIIAPSEKDVAVESQLGAMLSGAFHMIVGRLTMDRESRSATLETLVAVLGHRLVDWSKTIGLDVEVGVEIGETGSAILNGDIERVMDMIASGGQDGTGAGAED